MVIDSLDRKLIVYFFWIQFENILNDGGGRSCVWYVEGNGRDKSLVDDDDGKRGFVFEIRSGNLLLNDDCCCSSSFLLSDEDNLSFERCCWW